jgi:hypothetical protein
MLIIKNYRLKLRKDPRIMLIVDFKLSQFKKREEILLKYWHNKTFWQINFRQ